MNEVYVLYEDTSSDYGECQTDARTRAMSRLRRIQEPTVSYVVIAFMSVVLKCNYNLLMNAVSVCVIYSIPIV